MRELRDKEPFFAYASDWRSLIRCCFRRWELMLSRKTPLRAGLLQMLENPACSYSPADIWYIELIETKSISINSPGDGRSHAGGAEAEVASCCAGEGCFSRERWQGGKSATAHGPAPRWIWDNPCQLARVWSESPQLCTGNGRNAAQREKCRRKSSTEETWHGKYIKEKAWWKATSNTC